MPIPFSLWLEEEGCQALYWLEMCFRPEGMAKELEPQSVFQSRDQHDECPSRVRIGLPADRARRVSVEDLLIELERARHGACVNRLGMFVPQYHAETWLPL